MSASCFLQQSCNGTTGQVPVLEHETFSRTLLNFLKDCPRNTYYSPKMARNAKYAFLVTMALGRTPQAAGETLTGKSGLPELAPLLST